MTPAGDFTPWNYHGMGQGGPTADQSHDGWVPTHTVDLSYSESRRSVVVFTEPGEMIIWPNSFSGIERQRMYQYERECSKLPPDFFMSPIEIAKLERSLGFEPCRVHQEYLWERHKLRMEKQQNRNRFRTHRYELYLVIWIAFIICLISRLG